MSKIIWDDVEDIEDWNRFKTPPFGPIIYEADLGQEAIRTPLIEWLLNSRLFVEWEAWGFTEEQRRFPTPLTAENSWRLGADLAAVDEYGESFCWVLAAARSDCAEDGRLKGRHNKISDFLKTGKGMAFVIYQPNDCNERIFLARDDEDASALDQFLGLSLFSNETLQHWVQTTIRDGTLPP